MKYAMILAALLLSGCSHGSPAIQTALQAIKEPLSPFGKPHNGHPTVAHWYYATHRHPFDCLDSPEHKDYGCKSCPVGPPDRVITLSHGDYRDVPLTVNAFFACDSINMLIPEPSSDVDSDQFYCQREPPDGYVVLDGHKISCAGEDRGTSVNLGTTNPGETKEVEIPLTVK